jgi:hypothetical protein
MSYDDPYRSGRRNEYQKAGYGNLPGYNERSNFDDGRNNNGGLRGRKYNQHNQYRNIGGSGIPRDYSRKKGFYGRGASGSNVEHQRTHRFDSKPYVDTKKTAKPSIPKTTSLITLRCLLIFSRRIACSRLLQQLLTIVMYSLHVTILSDITNQIQKEGKSSASWLQFAICHSKQQLRFLKYASWIVTFILKRILQSGRVNITVLPPVCVVLQTQRCE